MKTAQQLVQRAQHLRGEPRRDLRLRFAARLEKRRQTPVGRVIVQAEGRKEQLEAAEHRPAADFAERAERKRQPAAGLAARSVNERAIRSSVEQEADRDLGFAQQALEPLVRRRFPAFERAALLGIDAAALDANEDLPAAFWVGHRPMWRKISCRSPRRLTDKSSGSAGPPETPATCAARQPRICAKNAQGSG